MIKIDLITGFLGAGKTTFLKKYAQYLLEQGQRICILENDFGAVNIDMLLLQDIMGENCELEMVAGGCDADCHKRRFKTKLISMGMRGFDRVLIEPSGIFDVDEFFDSLHEEPLDRWYEIGNVIAIVDAGLEPELSEESEYLLASQVADAGRIVLSKCQEASREDVADTVAHLNRVMEIFQCPRRFTPGQDMIAKDWAELEGEDYEKILNCGYVSENYRKLWFDQRDAFHSVYFMHVRMSEEKLRETAEKLLQDKACGNIFRIKGFMMAGENQWLELNAVQDNILIEPIEKGQEVLIVIGEGLAEEAIAPYFAPYIVKEGTPCAE